MNPFFRKLHWLTQRPRKEAELRDELEFHLGVAGAPPNDANRILTVGPAFFTTMQIPILAGRDIEERDRPGAPAVAVINQVFAKANFGDRNPLGPRDRVVPRGKLD
jgi:hypothetical protein